MFFQPLTVSMCGEKMPARISDAWEPCERFHFHLNFRRRIPNVHRLCDCCVICVDCATEAIDRESHGITREAEGVSYTVLHTLRHAIVRQFCQIQRRASAPIDDSFSSCNAREFNAPLHVGNNLSVIETSFNCNFRRGVVF